MAAIVARRAGPGLDRTRMDGDQLWFTGLRGCARLVLRVVRGEVLLGMVHRSTGPRAAARRLAHRLRPRPRPGGGDRPRRRRAGGRRRYAAVDLRARRDPMAAGPPPGRGGPGG